MQNRAYDPPPRRGEVVGAGELDACTEEEEGFWMSIREKLKHIAKVRVKQKVY